MSTAIEDGSPLETVMMMVFVGVVYGGRGMGSGSQVPQKGIGGKGWRGDKIRRSNVKTVSDGGTIEKINNTVPRQGDGSYVLKKDTRRTRGRFC